MYYCNAEDGQIAVLVTYTCRRHVFARDHEEELQRMSNHQLERCEGRDLCVPDKLIGATLMVTDEGTNLDQTLYANSIVIE